MPQTKTNNPGQNVTQKKDARTKCHSRNEQPGEMPLARALHFCKLEKKNEEAVKRKTAGNYRSGRPKKVNE